MTLKKYFKSFCLFLLFALSVLPVFNCGNKSNVDAKKSDPLFLDTVAVKAMQVRPGEIKLVKTYTGTLEGENQANIVSKISERITGIKVKVGDSVILGELVITLDKSGVTSQYYQAQAGYLNAEKDLNRMNSLFEAGAVSQQMLDGVKTSYEIAKANFDAAKAAVDLTAPVNGIVTAVNSNIGDLSVPGIPLMTIAGIKKMKVIFSVGEGDLPNFAVGQEALVYSEIKPDETRKGVIIQISKSAEIQSRSFDLKAIFTNTPDLWFKPGMFCRVDVVLQRHLNVISVPNISLINAQNSTALYIINGGKAVLRTVKTGLNDGNFTEILEGLKEGETVVTLGMNNLKQGSFVHITE